MKKDRGNDRMKKAFLLMKSLFTYALCKIRYGKRVEISMINSLRGKIDFFLKKNATLKIGKFLSCLGPLYLRCGENANMEIGNNCFFNRNCSVTAYKSITIGDNCMIANNVVIIDHDHKFNEKSISKELVGCPVVLGNNVWVGANTVILKGVKIGDGAIVAAGSVVTKNIAPYCIYAGVPAKKISQRGKKK